MSKESENALAIVGCNGDNALASHSVVCIARLTSAAAHQSAAVEVDEHRKVFVHLLGRSPDVKIQTIFAHFLRAEVHVAEDILLHRVGTKLLGLAHALPFLYGLRCFPSQIAHGRCCKGDALECLYARLVDTFECALSNVYSCRLLCKQYSSEQCKHKCQK